MTQPNKPTKELKKNKNWWKVYGEPNKMKDYIKQANEEFDNKWSDNDKWSGDFTSGSTGGNPNYDREKIKQFLIQKLKEQAMEFKKCIPGREEHIAILSNKELSTTGKLVEGRTIQDWIKYGRNQAISEMNKAIKENK